MGSVMVLKLPKIVHFLQIYADRKKPKYIKAIYIIKQSMKDFIIVFQKIVLFIGVQDINSSRDIKE